MVAPVLGTPSDFGSQAGLADPRFAEDPDPPECPVSARLVQNLLALLELEAAAAKELASIDLEFVGEHGDRWCRCREVGRSGHIWGFVEFDVREKAVTATVHGLDRPLRTAVIVDGPASLFDAGGQCGLGDESITPNVVEEFLFRDEPAALIHKITKDAEDLWFDLADAFWSDDLDRVFVDDECAETEAGHGLNVRTR